MICIISGTNRADSNTLRLATIYQQTVEACLKGLGMDTTVKLLDLRNKKIWERGEEMKSIEKEFLLEAEKFIFIMPEYNGSFPGYLKTMLDNSDIRNCYWGKKALLTGLADGRAGNLRGLEHMTNILHYLHVDVHWNKLPISRINEEMDANGLLVKAETSAAIKEQVSQFISY